MPQSLSWLTWVLVLAVFYIFLIMPEQRKQKKLRKMIQGTKVGDNIITRGGLYGRVAAVEDDKIILETGPNKVKLSLSKLSISSIIEPAAEKTEEKKEEYKEVK